MKTHLLKLLFALLAAAPAAAWAQILPATCHSDAPGTCQQWVVEQPSSQQMADPNPELLWDKYQWQGGLKSCEKADPNVPGLCARVLSIASFCKNSATAPGSKRRCERWGLTPSTDAEWQNKIANLTKDLILNLAEKPEVNRGDLKGSMAQVGFKAAKSEAISMALGETCANFYEQVIKDFEQPKSARIKANAVFDLEKPISHALNALTAAIQSWDQNYCRIPDTDHMKNYNLKVPEYCPRLREEHTLEQTVKFTEKVLRDIKKEYGCSLKFLK